MNLKLLLAILATSFSASSHAAPLTDGCYTLFNSYMGDGGRRLLLCFKRDPKNLRVVQVAHVVKEESSGSKVAKECFKGLINYTKHQKIPNHAGDSSYPNYEGIMGDPVSTAVTYRSQDRLVHSYDFFSQPGYMSDYSVGFAWSGHSKFGMNRFISLQEFTRKMDVRQAWFDGLFTSDVCVKSALPPHGL